MDKDAYPEGPVILNMNGKWWICAFDNPPECLDSCYVDHQGSRIVVDGTLKEPRPATREEIALLEKMCAREHESKQKVEDRTDG